MTAGRAVVAISIETTCVGSAFAGASGSGAAPHAASSARFQPSAAGEALSLGRGAGVAAVPPLAPAPEGRALTCVDSLPLVGLTSSSSVSASAATTRGPRAALDAADYLTARQAGRGAVREVCEQILRAQGHTDFHK